MIQHPAALTSSNPSQPPSNLIYPSTPRVYQFQANTADSVSSRAATSGGSRLQAEILVCWLLSGANCRSGLPDQESRLHVQHSR